ncbi:MAG TPA: DUF3352 domain-containing protein [Solirubrobacteraceae bacterium]
MPALRRPRLPFRLPARPLALLAVAAVPLAASGCGGSSSSGTSASPASVVPASAPLYVDAIVQPDGSLKTDALATGRRLTGRSNPFTGLLALLQGPTGHTPNYEHAVKPWLGPEAGLFLNSVEAAGAQVASLAAQALLRQALTKALAEGFTGAEGALLGAEGLPHLLGQSSLQGALVLDTSDVAKARSFLDTQAHSVGAHAVSYHGVTFQVATGGISEGIVHSFAVIGTEAGVKGVIDTAAGGATLAGAAAYSKLHGTAEQGRLANAYLDADALSSSVKSGGESLLGVLHGALGSAGQVYASVIPSQNEVALDLDTLPSTIAGSGSSGEATGTTGAQVLSGLPGNAWLAVGIGDLSKELGGSVQGLNILGELASTFKLGSIGVGGMFAPLHSHSLNVSRDLLSWMGPTGVYVAGSNVLALQAAVVISSKDPARSRAAVGKLAQAYREAGGMVASTSIPGTETAVTVKLPSFPLALVIADGQGKFVIGLGEASVQEALSPQSTLAGSALYTTAEQALGQGIKPSAAVEFHTLLGLIETLNLNQLPSFSGLAKGLQSLSGLAAGGGASLAGGVKRARVVLSLQPAG